MGTPLVTVVEADIAALNAALADGSVSSVELVARYLNRIGAYDRSGIRLNSVPVLNPAVFEEARAADARRARGDSIGVLDGIPFTAKDSYCVRGLTVAAGSPAFAELVAGDDAFAVARLREAGAVFLGLTTMPPMAAGGMQRGLYGRAESPYDPDYLTAAFGSGSSNGSGTATAAAFAAFGLGEETWSSGRAPASNNALVAYTPSRGVISVRGNWPLVPTMDVVVPHTRGVDDLRHVLDVVVADDPETEGDFWRTQPFVALPRPSEVRPESYAELPELPLAGVRLAAPRLYLNGDPESALPIRTRDSVIELWRALRADLEAAGAEVVETAFPVVENYEKLHAGSRDFVDRGFVTREFLDAEVGQLAIAAFDTFLRQNGDPALNRLADVDAARIFPEPPGALPDRYGRFPFDISYDLADYVAAAAEGRTDWTAAPGVEEGLRGLEHTRQVDFDDWLAAEGFDAVVFPAAADVGPADADVNEASADIAWRNGVWVSNGNLVPRHLGIPTVTVPLGVMSDTRMPVGLTIAGPAYSDSQLLRLAAAIEVLRPRRVAPPRTPPLADEAPFAATRAVAEGSLTVRVADVSAEVEADAEGDGTLVRFRVVVEGGAADELAAYVDGVAVPVRRATASGSAGDSSSASASATATATAILVGEHRAAPGAYSTPVSEWFGPFGPLVVVVARDTAGVVAGAVATTPGSPL